MGKSRTKRVIQVLDDIKGKQLARNQKGKTAGR